VVSLSNHSNDFFSSLLDDENDTQCMHS
jgi:hypothetical protein